jgi:hypothetical protein
MQTKSHATLFLSAFVFIVTLAATSQKAQATSFTRFENRRELPGSLRLIPELSFFSTSENFDQKSAKVKPASLTSYNRNQFDLTGIYGINSKWSAFARMSFVQNKYTLTGLNGSASGLSEQAFGANYRLIEADQKMGNDGVPLRGTTLDLQAQIELPIYDNVSSRLKRNPLLGEGSTDITIGPFITLPLNQGRGSRYYLVGGVGYMMRSGNFSAAVPYQLAFASMPESSGLILRGGIYGFKSMTTDGTSVLTSTNSDLRLDSGNSYINNALNSSYMAVKATLGYQLEAGTQIFGSYITTLTGTSTAVLSGFQLGAQFRFSTGKKSAPALKGAGSTGTPSSEFVNYTLEARIKVSNDRLNLVKIDKGEMDGVAKGQVFDIFKTKSDGSIDTQVATGKVTHVSANEAVINVVRYSKEIWIQPGFIAKRVIK